MKLLKGLIICFAVNFVSCQDSNSSLTLSNPKGSPLERKVLELSLEIGQLFKEIGDIKIENANLRLELLSAKENEKLFNESHNSWNKSFSVLVNNTELIADNLNILWENVNSTVGRIITNFPVLDEEVLKVACNAKLANNQWTVIQRRINGETNFYRPWAHYKVGFGNTKAEFFIGLDNLHILTTCANQELLIEMEDIEGNKAYAKYDSFEIGNESEEYALKKLGTYSGNAGDSLIYHVSQKFSTFDKDNDNDSRNCAKLFRGAWWYIKCHKSNLNGEYGNHNFGEGINWEQFRGFYNSLKFVEMKIKPIN